MSRRPTQSLSLPLTIDDITAEWVSEALSRRYPDVAVESVEVGDVIAGTATKVQLHLEYNDAGRAADLPETMFLKAGLTGELVEMLKDLYANEVWFYREIAPQLRVNVPTCYFGATDELSGQAAVLLEDLTARDVTFGRATEPLTPDAAAAALDLFARWHARWWGMPDEPDGLEVGMTPSARSTIGTMLEAPHWDDCMSLPRGAVVADQLKDRVRVAQTMNGLLNDSTKPPHCFLHGDAHLGNMYFEADGTPGVLDWQVVMRGQWAHDVTYFLIGALGVADRRAHEEDLLAHYLNRLGAHGVTTAPSFDEAWRAYRRHAIYQFIWILTPVWAQPEDVAVANAERFSAAAIDLETLAFD